MRIPVARLLVCCSLLLARTVAGQVPASHPAPTAINTAAVVADSAASLTLQGRQIFVFRSRLAARDPRDRRDDAMRKIVALVERGVIPRVHAARVPEGVLLTAGRDALFAILPGDVAAGSGETLEQLSTKTVLLLDAALGPEGTQRQFHRVTTAAALAAAATLAFIILLRLLGYVRQVVVSRATQISEARLRRLRIGGYELLDSGQVAKTLQRVVKLVFFVLALFAAYLWLTYVLTRFAYSAPWGEALGSYLIATVEDLGIGVLTAIPGLFIVVLIFLSTRFITRLVGAFFRAVESGEVTFSWLHPDTAHPTRRLITAMLWLFSIVIAYPYLPGSGSNAFKGVSVFVGLILTVGSSGLVSQAMSGLVLMYARSLKPGEYVLVNGIEGTVTELGLLSTKIRTLKEEEVTIPNSVLVSTMTRNYSRLTEPTGLILHTSVTIGYDTPWRQVHAMLIMAAKRTAGVREDSAPFVLQTALSDFYVEYQLNARIYDPARRVPVLSELHTHIQDAFNEHGVQIMSPHYLGDPSVPKIVRTDDWFTPPAASP